jgi:hypothetical protein
LEKVSVIHEALKAIPWGVNKIESPVDRNTTPNLLDRFSIKPKVSLSPPSGRHAVTHTRDDV